MEFIKYPSLTNHHVIAKKHYLNPHANYIATEKIHGANISIVVDNDDHIDITKRTSFLTEKEHTIRPWNTLSAFASEQRDLILEWTEAVRAIAQSTGPIKQVHFYGELYGSSVQKMDYQENKDKVRKIRFFDIHVLFENEQRLALAQEDLSLILGRDSIAPVLRRGKLLDLILSTEELESIFGGAAEGQVYKPAKRYIFGPDDYGNLHYPVVKHKYEAFSEKKNRSMKEPVVYTDAEQKLVNAVDSRITKQRLLNILSHGDIELDSKNTKQVITTMIDDIKKEIADEEPDVDLSNGHLIGKRGGNIAALFRDYLNELNAEALNNL